MNNPVYYEIMKHYEKCFKLHGATYRGMDWPNEKDLSKRFKIMLEIIRSEYSNKISILDLGCGVGLLSDYIDSKNSAGSFDYWGIDISDKIIQKAIELHPHQRFETKDILKESLPENCIDYVIMNGLLTEKVSLDQKTMELFAGNMIKSAFSACRHGVAFNVMSSHVDWCRPDLFHWELDRAVNFLVKNCSRHLTVRMDYGLYEYTLYIYKEANV